MKDTEFEFDNIIKFKPLTDNISSADDIVEAEDELDLDKLLDSGVVELFKEMLSEEL